MIYTRIINPLKEPYMNHKDVLDQIYTALNNVLETTKKVFEVQRSLIERAVEQFETTVKAAKK